MPKATSARGIQFLALSALLAAAPLHAEVETLIYTLAPDPQRGRTAVELEWTTAGRTESALGVSPQWGSLDDVPSILRDMQIDGAENVRRQGSLWIMKHRPGGVLRCSYVVDPGRRKFDWPLTHHPITSRRFFHGMGNAFLLIPHEVNGASEAEFQVLLRWRVPEGWQAACSWGVGRHLGDRVRATDLRNSVYLAGELKSHRIQRDGLQIEVVAAAGVDLDLEPFAEMVTKIVTGQVRFMNERDFPPFVVTVVPVGEELPDGNTRLSGTGLYHSFCLFVPPNVKVDDGMEHLLAHELLHYWNGRAVRAAEPERHVFWFVEGLTDYYSLRILHESGYWKPRLLARWLNRHLRDYQLNPARSATNEEIAARFWTDRDTYGEVAYQRGLLLGLRWHYLARSRGVPDGLDRLFKTLVERGRREGLRLDNATIRRVGIETLGAWFGEEFDRHVVAALPVEVPPGALAPALNGRMRTAYEYQLGFDRDRSLQSRRVTGLIDGSAAAAAGLREGDELAGWNIYTDTDTQITLKVLRGEKIETIRYFARGRQFEVLQFQPASAE